MRTFTNIFLTFLACNDTVCVKKHTECQQYNKTRDAACVCRDGFYLDFKERCKTRPIIFKLRIRFTMPFLPYLFDLLNELTINFMTEMQGRIKVALKLKPNAIVLVVRYIPGSTIVDFNVRKFAFPHFNFIHFFA